MIEIYTKSNCSYCVHAKNYMNNNNMKYTEYKLDKDFSRDDIKSKFPTASTYPVIVMEGKYIGGFSDLKELHESNKKILSEGEWNGA